LLDEPLGALDRHLREQLQVELKELQRSLGVTMVLVTHDQEEALSLSDRLALIDKGRVQQVASPSEAYLRPANRFVAEFLGIANFVRTGDGNEAIVRPERLQVTLQDESCSANVTGRVRQTVYLGQAIRIYVVLDNGAELVATVSSSDPAAHIRPDDRVGVSWRPDDAWCLP
jgi:putative spermidine/putrescine transport system ATP-binding protein